MIKLNYITTRSWK